MSRVIILGAGASAGYEGSKCGLSPPVSRTIFAQAEALAKKQLLDFKTFPELNNFLRTYYCRALEPWRDSDGAPHLDVEEILTMIDLAGAAAARQELLRLLVTVLNETLLGTPCGHHKRLLESLSPADTIINFNWDLLLDNITARSNRRNPDYGACSTVFNIKKGCHEDLFKLPHRPKVLKLHGSLNWLHCRSCNKTHAFMLEGKVGKSYFAGEAKPCPDCRGGTEPLIIPPTLLKSYEHPVIREIWDLARVALTKADEIVVVGYSLPLTDFRARWLFMEATAKSKTKLCVFDKCRNDDLLRRLGSSFHVSSECVKGTKGGIKEAAEYFASRPD